MQAPGPLDEREVGSVAAGFSEVDVDAGQIGLEDPTRRVRDERVVLVGQHVLALDELELGVHVELASRPAQVPRTDSVVQRRPPQTRCAGCDVEIELGQDLGRRGGVLLAVVVDLLEGEAGVGGGDLSEIEADGDLVRLADVHGGDVPGKPLLVQLLRWRAHGYVLHSCPPVVATRS